MKIISIAEFETLVARNDWQREQDLEVVERLVRQVEEWDEENESPHLIDIPHVWGWASKTSTLDGIKITYTEGFSYDECDPDSLSTGTEGQDEVWSVEGIVVVDEEGDELNAHELADYLNSDFSRIDYSVLEIEQVVDIDVDEDSDMETFTLEIDNAPSIRFTGELVASAASSDNQAMGGSYSGQTGRWTELALYKTKGGKFVCHQIGRTRWQGERDRFSGKVCETLEEVKEFFGHRWLAKELYAEAGIDDVVEVSMTTSVIEITPQNMTKKDWDNLNEAMSRHQDQFIHDARKLAQKLGVSLNCAVDVLYFRSRSRWTQEKEDELIRLYEAGTPPNMNEFG